MRFVLPVAALVLLAAPACAQTAPPATPSKTVTATLPAPAPPVATAPAPHHRETAEQRFTKANATHDGHLTLAQAKTGYPTVAKHFTEIDAAKKGYVTAEQIRAWEKAERELHHAAKPAAVPPGKG